ncbi:hypothetical protein ASE01_04540 [Nocardioides sp. Root190]|uniref:alpha/beta hydrolase n=1 Tax=Nocardioides sp. Root190 TaxID=1736488 RepID=UPI0006F5251D|nr:alpha/beta hydrolase-fold protein [Nocardioides sp. Root190]KRB78533.1 hypothetical protein ASE01_04540 [Nocardioides sp. Root190]
MKKMSRRALLWAGGGTAAAGGAVATGIQLEVLPGRSSAYHHLGLDGGEAEAPDVEPATVEWRAFRSQARGRRVGWALARPAGAPAGLPVVVVLHGRGQDHTAAFRRTRLALDRFLADAVARGVPPFAIASVDGDESYWHDRSDGDRAATMVVDELLPRLEESGLDTSRVAFTGWSMGGFGALHLASRLGPDRVAAVAAMSPALWHRYADTAPGAYDDASDFEQVTVLGRQDELDGIAVRVDCGKGDPFFATCRDYVEGFARRPAGRLELGDHDSGYWRRIAPGVLRFLGEALAS